MSRHDAELSLFEYTDEDLCLLTSISIRHVSNLGISNGCLDHRPSVEQSWTTRSNILEPRKAHPAGQHGILRSDTGHQVNWGKQKEVYHINAVDEVTPFQMAGTLKKISEASRLPVLENISRHFLSPSKNSMPILAGNSSLNRQ